ncbi:MAG: hypothetical protein O2960_00220 [Verrucomicrobia bacterium]|nr:hypothetical protein [Verrucomicrobiota bacterium]
MKKLTGIFVFIVSFAAGLNFVTADDTNPSPSVNLPPLGKTGSQAWYRIEKAGELPGSVVKEFRLTLGAVEYTKNKPCQWIRLDATKADGKHFRVWLLSAEHPSRNVAEASHASSRYILQEGERMPLEFRHRYTGTAVLPSIGGWEHLFPRPLRDPADASAFATRTEYLGHDYRLEELANSEAFQIPAIIDLLDLLPDVLVGVPSNTRQKDETRRYDDSDYEMIPLTREDFSTSFRTAWPGRNATNPSGVQHDLRVSNTSRFSEESDQHHLRVFARRCEAVGQKLGREHLRPGGPDGCILVSDACV